MSDNFFGVGRLVFGRRPFDFFEVIDASKYLLRWAL